MRDDMTDLKNGKEEFEPLLDSQQGAELMQVHPETVKRRARRGEIPELKFGKLWRFRGLCPRILLPRNDAGKGGPRR